MNRWGRVGAAVAVAALMALSGVPPGAFGPGAPLESVETARAAEWDFTGTEWTTPGTDNGADVADGFVYILDEDGTVREYYKNGTSTGTSFDASQCADCKYYGIEKLDNGNYIIVEGSINDRAIEVDSSGSLVEVKTGSEIPSGGITGVEETSDGFYITEKGAGTKVFEYSSDWTHETNHTGLSNSMGGIEKAKGGHIYITDATDGDVHEFYTNFTQVTTHGLSEQGSPNGIGKDPDTGNWFVAGGGVHEYEGVAEGTSGGDPPYVDSISPNDGEYLNTTNRSTNLNATLKDPESDPIDATIYWNPLNGSGWHQVASETDITSGNEISATVDAAPGENWWKVETDDDVNGASNSTRFEFYVGDQVVVYNGSDYTLANSSTITINATSTVDNWKNDTQITNAKFDWIPAARHEHRVKISHPWKFKNTTITVEDPAEPHFVLLAPNSDNGTVSNWPNAGKTHSQCFELDDGTGNFPPSDTVLRAKQYYDGEWRLADNDRFGADNNASLWLQDGETYRLSIKSDEGNVRSLNEFEADSSINGCVTLVVESEDEDAVGPEDSDSVEEGTVNGTDVGYAWDAWRVENGSGLPYLKFEWELADANASTESFQVKIYEYQNQSNRTIYNNSFGSINSIEHRQDLNSSQENDTWVVQWNATIDGTKVNGSRVLGPQDIGPGLPVDQFWKELAALAGILMVAGLAGGARAEAGAILASLTAGIFFLLGWLPPEVGAGVILAALTVGALYYAATEGEPT